MNLSIFNFKHLKVITSFVHLNLKAIILIFFSFGAVTVTSAYILNIMHPQTFRPNQRTEAVKKISKETKVLFLGPSHFFSGIDPREINVKSVTLSTGSLNYQTQLIILKKHINELKNLKLIVLELDNVPLTINTTHNRKNRFEGDFRDLIDLGLGYYDIPGLNFFSASLYSFQDSFFRPLTKGPKFTVSSNSKKVVLKKTIIPGFIPDETKMTKKELKEKIRTKKSRAKSIYDMEKANSQALKLMIDILLERNIKIAFLRMPRTTPNKKNLDRLKELISFHKFPLWDFESSPSLTKGDFRDPNHLNMYGAKKISTVINKKINSYLK
jgi:hypothetical protein